MGMSFINKLNSATCSECHDLRIFAVQPNTIITLSGLLELNLMQEMSHLVRGITVCVYSFRLHPFDIVLYCGLIFFYNVRNKYQSVRLKL